MEENKRLEQGFDDPGRQVLRNIIVHFTTTANNSYDVWADVVRQYLLTAYNTEEKHSAIPVAGKIYKVLKRDGVTVFYDESGQTLFDVENDRLAKEHELLSAENAAEEPVEESTEEPMEAPEEKPGEGPKSQIGKVIAGIERQAFDAAVNSGKTEDTEGKKDPIPMGTTSLFEEFTEEYFMDQARALGEEYGVDTRQGSLFMDAATGHCIRIAKFMNDLKTAFEMLAVDTCTGDILTEKAAQDGIYRQSATPAYYDVTFSGTTPELGSREYCKTLVISGEEEVIVRASAIGSIISAAESILDYDPTSLRLSEATGNISIGKENAPVVREVLIDV